MSSFGVVPEGFSRKLISDILADIEDDQRTNINPLLNLLSTSVFGQINGTVGDRLRELWEVAEAAYNAFNPDLAEGAALDAIAAITGAIRLPATNSTVTLTVELDPGTTLTVGRLVSSSVTGVQFTTIEEVTNPGPGVAFLSVEAQSVDLGPVAAPAGVLTGIDTPVTGWQSVTNALDAAQGTNIESDEDFRTRRVELLRSTGAGTLEAIRASVRDVDGVTQAFVFENFTLVTQGPPSNLPGKAFEVVVSGGTEADIAQAIFDTKPVGIEPFGAITQTVVDSQGFSTDIKFSRPAEKLIFVDTAVTYDPNLFPIDGDDQVKAAIVSLGEQLLIGEDVIIVRFQCGPLDVAGVVDVTLYEHDPAPTSTVSANSETYNLVGGETLDVLVESENIQQVTFQVADFAAPGSATAAEVAARILTDLGASSVTTSGAGGVVTISTIAGGSVLVVGGTANAELAFPTTINPSTTTNLPIGFRELARFDTSRITVTSVPA